MKKLYDLGARGATVRPFSSSTTPCFHEEIRKISVRKVRDASNEFPNICFFGEKRKMSVHFIETKSALSAAMYNV